jgi:hypothetical protein
MVLQKTKQVQQVQEIAIKEEVDFKGMEEKRPTTPYDAFQDLYNSVHHVPSPIPMSR